MSRVFAVQQHRRFDREAGELVDVHDLSPALRFGELLYLLSPTAAPWAVGEVVEELEGKLWDYRPEDYLLMVGNPVLCCLAAVVAARASGGRLRFLQWNGRSHEYIPVEAQVSGVGDGEAQVYRI